MSVYRIYVEKKPQFAVEGKAVLSDLKTALQIKGIKDVRIVNRYDAEGITKENFEKATPTVFSEPPVDDVYYSLPEIEADEKMFATEFLPGQFDQRADSAAQCIQMLCQGERPTVKYAKLYILKGDISDEDFTKIKHYLINAVEARECGFEQYETLDVKYDIPKDVAVLDGFIGLSEDELAEFIKKYALAMDLGDIKFCQEYFKKEQRDPTLTEIRMIDTYWSDHCRHTTFGTIIDNAKIDAPYIAETYKEYKLDKEELGRSAKPVCLMDIATAAVRKLKKDGLLPDLDESEEINACSVKITVDVDGKDEQWLLMFKNETHNHPTEIEPFGGAATCLGGAIRDPLSGRSYVYQAMRVTGASDPLLPVDKTIPGKLPPRKITTTAAQGYSSYGNQIGLATGHVAEIYDPGYMAKRMEIGAVIGAAPAENVVRERPVPGDIIILLGGRTGRDGCGGATGSSKSHSVESLETCGAEVQKGNAPEERKLQRLFRDKNATKLIKRCNDFGAGGVSVAIGELADGLEIDLNAVPKKYDGLDGTELAISESQERMAVVVDKNDVDKFIALAGKENLEATPVAVVTENPRLKMNWNGKTICDISREFLNSNGAEKHTDIYVPVPTVSYSTGRHNTKEEWEKLVTDLNVCSQKGLVQRFDSTIGAGTVLMPYSGKTQQTPVQAMAAKLPVLSGNTKTASIMAWGFDPFVSRQSPYHAAALAVVESMAKVVAAGGKSEKCWLTFQEYFERTQGDPERWGKPFAALLGAYKAQIALSSGAIGGKDSMSGTFENITVPPTLVSFAIAADKAGNIISPEFKKPGSRLVFLPAKPDENGLPAADSLRTNFALATRLIRGGSVLSAWAVDKGGAAEGLFKAALGNGIGVRLNPEFPQEELFRRNYGALILEIAEGCTEQIPNGIELGSTTSEFAFEYRDENVALAPLFEIYDKKLEPVYRHKTTDETPVEIGSFRRNAPMIKPNGRYARPRVLIPVFPGTNCEMDSARAMRLAGAEAEVLVINNITAKGIEESVNAFANRLEDSQILFIPGGFSGGDEPEGSAKLIESFMRNARAAEAIERLLNRRDGLILGICNGFQALIKLGLVPFGKIIHTDENCPTLTYNTIGLHRSRLVHTRTVSNLSPWLMYREPGEVSLVPVSHGEGRFVCPDELLNRLVENGQIATVYCDASGRASMRTEINPNGSVLAVEGITSADGRVFGKMAHSERYGKNLYKNVPGKDESAIFRGAVDYFRL